MKILFSSLFCSIFAFSSLGIGDANGRSSGGGRGGTSSGSRGAARTNSAGSIAGSNLGSLSGSNNNFGTRNSFGSNTEGSRTRVVAGAAAGAALGAAAGTRMASFNNADNNGPQWASWMPVSNYNNQQTQNANGAWQHNTGTFSNGNQNSDFSGTENRFGNQNNAVLQNNSALPNAQPQSGIPSTNDGFLNQNSGFQNPNNLYQSSQNPNSGSQQSSNNFNRQGSFGNSAVLQGLGNRNNGQRTQWNDEEQFNNQNSRLSKNYRNTTDFDWKQWASWQPAMNSMARGATRQQSNRQILTLLLSSYLGGRYIRKVANHNTKSYMTKYQRYYWIGDRYYYLDPDSQITSRETCFYSLSSNDPPLFYEDNTQIQQIVFQCKKYFEQCCGLDCCKTEHLNSAVKMSKDAKIVFLIAAIVSCSTVILF